MYRHRVGNFKDIVFLNTMWDLQRLLQDKLPCATSQANWADVPQPLELIRTAVAADVLNHFAFEAAQGCYEYDPEEAIELRGDTLRSAREFLIGHFHAETRHTIGDVLDDAVEDRAAALLNPAFVRLGLANPVEQVWQAAETEGGELAHHLVEEVYEQLRSGSPCLPPYLVRTEGMTDKLDELMTALLPVLNSPGLEIDKKSSPADVYADTLQNMAREYVRYMLNAVGTGATVWTCDHEGTPSRLAGEILADLALTPIHDSNYSCAAVAMPAALVLREMHLVMQVLEDHLETGELRLYADEEYQTRWRRLHRRGAIPEVSEEMHAAAVATVLKPFFKEAFGVVNTMMSRLDNWQVERLPADGIYPRPKASPVEGEQLDEEAAEAAEAEDDEDMDDDPVPVGDEAVISERQFVTEAAEDEAPETRLALAVVTNLLADFTRLSEDHLRMVEERPLTAQTPKEKELQTLQQEVVLDIMGSLKEEAHDRWGDLLREGAHTHGLTAPDEMRTFFSNLLGASMGEKFADLAEETASGMTDAYLHNPAWSRLALFDSGSQAMDEGIETARQELRVIFRKLTRGTAFLGTGELEPGLSTDCQSALEAAGKDIGKILRKATRSVRKLAPSGPNTLDTCAHEVMGECVNAVLSAARSPDGGRQLAGLMVGPLGLAADLRNFDEEAPATTAPALLLREVEIALCTVACSLTDGYLKHKVLSLSAACMAKGSKQEVFVPDHQNYLEAIRPTLESLEDICDTLSQHVQRHDHWSPIEQSPLSMPVLAQGCRLQ
jgi:hypothetical protein